MLAGKPLFAFVPTTDMDRAAAFYGDTLGLDVLEHTTYAVVLDAGGTTVRVTLVQELQPQPFTILKANQTISFGALPSKRFGDPPFTISASASSGLPVSFTASGGCTLSGSTVTLTGTSGCSIKASQAGNANYNAAADVIQTTNSKRKTFLPIAIR